MSQNTGHRVARHVKRKGSRAAIPQNDANANAMDSQERGGDRRRILTPPSRFHCVVASLLCVVTCLLYAIVALTSASRHNEEGPSSSSLTGSFDRKGEEDESGQASNIEDSEFSQHLFLASPQPQGLNRAQHHDDESRQNENQSFLSTLGQSTASVAARAVHVSPQNTTPADWRTATLKMINPPRPFATAADSLKDNAKTVDHVSIMATLEQKDKRIAEEEAGFKCPPFRYPKGRSADSQLAVEAIHKYARYAKDYCNTTGVLQMQVPFDVYIHTVLDKIAAIVNLKRGDRIFDFGSGCGTMLNYFNLRFGSRGIGIDITEDAVKFAMGHRRDGNVFCHMNAETQLIVDAVDDAHPKSVSIAAAAGPASLPSTFQPNSFDAIVSWGVLHHIRRSLSQCLLLGSMVKMLKPGGKMFIGHLRHDRNDYWKKGVKCKIEGATIKRVRDGTAFRLHHWRKHGFGSLIVHKLPLNSTG